MINEYKKYLDEAVGSLEQQERDELFEYYNISGIFGLYRVSKDIATSTKRYADNRGYGQGECGYYFSCNSENEHIFEDFPKVAKYIYGLAECYFDAMYELDNA